MSHTGKIFITVIITALIVGGGIYVWQQNNQKKYSSQNTILETSKNESQKPKVPVYQNEPEEWKIIREYVTSTYPISKEYFDSHFQFTAIKEYDLPGGEYDYENDKFKTLLPGVKRVDYILSLFDDAGNKYNFSNFTRIHLSNNKVIESKDIPTGLSPYEKSVFNSISYDITGPTKELKILISKGEAVKLAKSNPECVSFKDSATEDKFALEFTSGEVFWNWQGINGNCKINAENGVIVSQPSFRD